jgi:hypothetical protein
MASCKCSRWQSVDWARQKHLLGSMTTELKNWTPLLNARSSCLIMCYRQKRSMRYVSSRRIFACHLILLQVWGAYDNPEEEEETQETADEAILADEQMNEIEMD